MSRSQGQAESEADKLRLAIEMELIRTDLGSLRPQIPVEKIKGATGKVAKIAAGTVFFPIGLTVMVMNFVDKFDPRHRPEPPQPRFSEAQQDKMWHALLAQFDGNRELATLTFHYMLGSDSWLGKSDLADMKKLLAVLRAVESASPDHEIQAQFLRLGVSKPSFGAKLRDWATLIDAVGTPSVTKNEEMAAAEIVGALLDPVANQRPGDQEVARLDDLLIEYLVNRSSLREEQLEDIVRLLKSVFPMESGEREGEAPREKMA